MAKVLVTGANGMLGQDLCPILEQNGYEVFKTDISLPLTKEGDLARGVGKSLPCQREGDHVSGGGILDITDFHSVISVISEQKPDIVIHCAAYTNVDRAEEDYETAHKINATGTENLAKVCGEKNITLVYISTDYVFSGKEIKILKPTDDTNPLNNYGLTKWQGEQAVRKYCKKYYIARTAWLYGIHGRNFVETMISLADKPELKVVDDQVGCPTWTVELCNGIIKLLSGKAFGTYHVCGGGQTSWYGFAKEIFNLSGLNVNLKPCTTDEFPRPAERPAYSVMDNGGLCRPWQDALKDYITIR